MIMWYNVKVSHYINEISSFETKLKKIVKFQDE